MLLNELKTKLDEATASYHTAHTEASNEATAERHLFSKINKLKNQGQYILALEVERDELPLQRAKTAEATARRQEALNALRQAEASFNYQRQRALAMMAEAEALSQRLGPGGYHARQVAEAEKRLEMFQAGRGVDERKLSELRAKVAELTDIPEAQLRRYQKEPALIVV